MAATGTYAGEINEITVTASATTTVEQSTAASLKAEVVGPSAATLAKDSTLTDKSQTTQVVYGGAAIDPRAVRAIVSTTDSIEAKQGTAANLKAEVVGPSGAALAKDSTLTDKTAIVQVAYGGAAVDPRSIRALASTGDSVEAKQSTASNLKAEVSQGTASSLNATVVQGTASNLKAEVSQGTASSLKAQVSSVGNAVTEKHSTAPVEVALSTSTARSTQLPAGEYHVTCNANCCIRQGGSAVDATTAMAKLWQYTYRRVTVTGSSDDYIAGIVASGTATLSIERVDA